MDEITQFDGNLLSGLQEALNAEWLTPIMKAITLLAEYGIILIAACLLLIIFRKTRRLGIICALSLAMSFLVCNVIIKPIVDRPRPWTLFETIIRMMPELTDGSFPSGHTTNSMGVAWALFINTLPVKKRIQNEEDGTVRYSRSYDEVPCLGWKGVGADPHVVHRISVIVIILAFLIGLSRLYLGMHFPTDVICGLLIGMICAEIIHYIVIKIESTRGIIGGENV